MKLTESTKEKDIRRSWYLFDVKDKILGRITVDIAGKLIGKYKPYFVPNLDCGDYAVVINAEKVKVSGKKSEQKMYQRFSGYPAGLKSKPFKKIMVENPTRIVLESVSGMLPKNKLRASMLKRLYIFPGEEHPYKNKFK